ncbi:MAG: hypothetical protein M1153_00020 [Patescibacteria group bacterium]|nr:hypothetical protein [Patescibacteria group bacterium]
MVFRILFAFLEKRFRNLGEFRRLRWWLTFLLLGSLAGRCKLVAKFAHGEGSNYCEVVFYYDPRADDFFYVRLNGEWVPMDGMYDLKRAEVGYIKELDRRILSSLVNVDLRVAPGFDPFLIGRVRELLA